MTGSRDSLVARLVQGSVPDHSVAAAAARSSSS